MVGEKKIVKWNKIKAKKLATFINFIAFLPLWPEVGPDIFRILVKGIWSHGGMPHITLLHATYNKVACHISHGCISHCNTVVSHDKSH